jgi:hypothetical protein
MFTKQVGTTYVQNEEQTNSKVVTGMRAVGACEGRMRVHEQAVNYGG